MIVGISEMSLSNCRKSLFVLTIIMLFTRSPQKERRSKVTGVNLDSVLSTYWNMVGGGWGGGGRVRRLK